LYQSILSLHVVELELAASEGNAEDWTEGVDVNEDVASRPELNDCDAADDCVELVEDAPEAESWIAEGLAGVVVAGAAEFSVVDGVGASTT
jgi:hypothetical protein